ncbi:MAG: hydroxyacid dehydrogenase [Acidimicrobiia bacterium]|nr:hydroxyacid dehydrogenase [Acidimicrobiia bacterium]MDH5238130.1 hydroxyacid dehydrogenase [Acidimicrobiia bacterium]
MRILFADAIDDAGLQKLRAAGHRCELAPELTADDLPAALPDSEVLVVRSTRVTAEAIEAAGALELIVRAGAGTNTIDTTAASDHGVFVCNVPGRNAIAVAELTMGLLLAVDRHIADATADARRGQWNKAKYSRADGLHGKTMAIIGLGEVGLAVAERAKAFGLTVSALRKDGRPSPTEARIRAVGVRLVDDLTTLVTEADIATIHVPGGAATQGLVDDAFLRLLGDDGILLNTSRGDVVDEPALLAALDRGLRAGLDVFPDEPGGEGRFDSALAGHPNVVATHHIGASTTQAQEAVAAGTIEVIEQYAAGELTNCVNLETDRLGTCTLTIRHLDRVGVLAQVLAVLRANGHNVQQMANQIFRGGNAAAATIRIDGRPQPGLATDLAAIAEVLSATIRHHDG